MTIIKLTSELGTVATTFNGVVNENKKQKDLVSHPSQQDKNESGKHKLMSGGFDGQIYPLTDFRSSRMRSGAEADSDQEEQYGMAGTAC